MTYLLPLLLASALQAAPSIPEAFATAQWISAESDQTNSVWRFSRTFVLTSPPASATLRLCALGAFEARLNGHPINTDCLAPGYAEYARRLPYETYSVAPLLQVGTNRLEVTVANGYGPGFTSYSPAWRLPKRLIAALSVSEAKGSQRTLLVSDGQWQVVTETHLRESDLYDGESWDWTRPEGKPLRATVVGHEGGRLEPRKTLRLVRHESLKPKSLWRVGEEAWLVDFGRNLAGFVELDVGTLQQETLITISHAEELTEDRKGLDRWTNGGAQAKEQYRIPAGARPMTLAPRFVYHGFRYALVEGLPQRLDAAQIRAQTLYADVRPQRELHPENPLEAHLVEMAVNSIKANLMTLPTDCAVRDERAPCLMDTHTYWRVACELFDLRDYTRAWCQYINDAPLEVTADRLESLSPLDGKLTTQSRRGQPDWSGVVVNTPYVAWRVYGERSFVEESYPAVKRYLDFICGKVAPSGWVVTLRGYGDWAAPNEQGSYHTSSADVPLVNTALLHRLLGYGAEMADEMRDTAAAARWRKAQRLVAEGFRKTFRRKDGLYGSGSLAASALTLGCGLVSGNEADLIFDKLKQQIENDACQTRVGIFGARELFRLLAARGERGLILRMLAVEQCPSFGYWRKLGATTMWEQWVRKGPMASHSHVMFAGAIEYLLDAQPEKGNQNIRRDNRK